MASRCTSSGIGLPMYQFQNYGCDRLGCGSLKLSHKRKHCFLLIMEKMTNEKRLSSLRADLTICTFYWYIFFSFFVDLLENSRIVIPNEGIWGSEDPFGYKIVNRFM